MTDYIRSATIDAELAKADAVIAANNETARAYGYASWLDWVREE